MKRNHDCSLHICRRLYCDCITIVGYMFCNRYLISSPISRFSYIGCFQRNYYHMYIVPLSDDRVTQCTANCIAIVGYMFCNRYLISSPISRFSYIGGFQRNYYHMLLVPLSGPMVTGCIAVCTTNPYYQPLLPILALILLLKKIDLYLYVV